MNSIETARRPRTPLQDQPKAHVYQAESILISHNDRAPADEGGIADALFDSCICRSPSFRRRYLEVKRGHWRALTSSADRAIRLGGCLRYSRANGSSTAVFRNVVGAAVERELLRELRSPPGSLGLSRLIPSEKLRRLIADYRPSLANRDSRPIIVRTADDVEMPIDPTHPTVHDYRSKLELINRVNSGSAVTYWQYDENEERFLNRRICYPQHRAIFREDLDHGGRMYGDGLSHQNLRRIERQSIEFDGRPCVELDLSCCQPRMCYHSLGIDRGGDLYFKQSDKSDDRRFLRKQVLLIALNAASRSTAVHMCRESENVRTESGRYKMGRTLAVARHLQDARRQTGLEYGSIYDELLQIHAPIAQFFRKGTTMELQPRESRVALNVMHHFALQGIPCLSVFDSFIVPAQYENELRAAINRRYFNEFGFLPEIGDDDANAQPILAA